MTGIRKVSVVGAGALGTFVGAMIQRQQPDLEVQLICRGSHLEALRKRGTAELQGVRGTFQIPVKADDRFEAIAGSDLVLFTVKTQDTDATAAECASHWGNAIVVSLQNGINQRVLAKHIASDRLVAGMTATNMTLIEPGVVRMHRDGVSVIGAASAEVSEATAQQALEVLSASGMTFELVPDILGVQYNKLLFNTMGYTSALSKTDFIRDGLLYGPWRKSLALPLLDEGMRVLAGAGITLHRASGGSDVIRLRRLLGMLNTPGLDVVVRAISGFFRPPRLVFSVSHDIEKGRATEIPFVNGEIVRVAKESGQQAPMNAAVLQAVETLQNGRPGEFYSRAEMIHQFRQISATLLKP